jgi:rod shape-determining protein MreC
MWVIIRWIRTNAYPLLALLLFSFSFNLVLRYQLYQHSYYFNNSVAFFRGVDQTRTNFTIYLGLRKENEYLKNENAQLRQQLNQKHPDRYQSHDTVFRDTSLPQSQQPTYTYLPAEVVRNTTNKRDNYFYINQGTNQGIETGMAVLSPKGVAGVVVTTSGNFSRVMSVLHSDFELTPFIPDLNLRQGVVKWEGTDARFGYLKEVNRTEDVKKGQWILSSNYSSIFPPSIPVGRVVATSKPLQQQYQQIKIVFATDFHRLHYVYCVKNHVKAEIDALNTTTQP